MCKYGNFSTVCSLPVSSHQVADSFECAESFTYGLFGKMQAGGNDTYAGLYFLHALKGFLIIYVDKY